MAGTVTHGYFVNDVYNKLDLKTKNNLNNYLDYLRCYGQCHDVFYFSIKKNIRSLGDYAQMNYTRLFFINMINYIKEKSLKDSNEVMSLLYGFICHYTLDYNVHPYINYKTGIYNKNDKNTYKYRCKHQDMESYIDSYFIREKDNIEPGKLKINKFCLNINPSNEAIEMLNDIYKKTFNYDNIGNEFFKALKNMRLMYIIFRNDPNKIKKKIYNAVDKITSKYSYKLSPISLAYKKEEKDYYLNKEHKPWNHPMDKNEIYDYSFIDLYNNAIKDALNIIKNVNEYLFENKNSDLNITFKNYSFSTGKDCQDKRKEKYFEY